MVHLNGLCRAYCLPAQEEDFVVPSPLLTAILIISVFGSLIVAAVLVVIQMRVKNAKLKRLKYAASGTPVVCTRLSDSAAFHLFLSHAWPAAQDRMRIVKQRLAEVLPSCRVFLDVDASFCGSVLSEIDNSLCILVRAQESCARISLQA